MTNQRVGTVLGQLVSYNRIDLQADAHAVLDELIHRESLILPGGLLIRGPDGRWIGPGCCCGLEGWREWLDFLKTGHSPWLGHDPSPWLEIREDQIRVWSDGGVDPAPEVFHIDMDRQAFERELHNVQHEFIAFLDRVRQWAQGIGFSDADALSAMLDGSFSITGVGKK